MNEYKLEYWNHTGCFKTEHVNWECSGSRYTWNYENSNPVASNYYIVAYKLQK